MCVISSMQFSFIFCETKVRVVTYQINLWYERIECTSIFLIKFKHHRDIENTNLYVQILCSNMAPTHKRGSQVCIQIQHRNMWIFIYHHWAYRWCFHMNVFKVSFISCTFLSSLSHLSHMFSSILLSEYSVSTSSVNLTL